MNGQASPATLIISAMITPALLILGSASLAATALQRLARAVDRARFLLQDSGADPQGRRRGLRLYGRRAATAERAVFAFYAAIGTFVLGCLCIAVDRAFGDRLTWLPVSLTILGMATMLYGAVLMVLESRIAGAQIRDELRLLPPGGDDDLPI